MFDGSQGLHRLKYSRPSFRGYSSKEPSLPSHDTGYDNIHEEPGLLNMITRWMAYEHWYRN